MILVDNFPLRMLPLNAAARQSMMGTGAAQGIRGIYNLDKCVRLFIQSSMHVTHVLDKVDTVAVAAKALETQERMRSQANRRGAPDLQ